MNQTLEGHVHDALAKVRDGQTGSVASRLQEVMPDVIRALIHEATADTSSVSHRQWALREILALFGRVIRFDARKIEAETRKARAIGKREAAIAARARAKADGQKAALQQAAAHKRYSRLLAKAKKEQERV